MAVVYWAYDDSCKNPSTDGYVGVTKRDPIKRFKQHKYLKRVPEDAKFRILFEGTLCECKLKEREYRPRARVGWNVAKGGGGGGMVMRSHTLETKRKMAEARAAWHTTHPDAMKGNTSGRFLKGKKKPPGHAEKLRAIAKSRYKVVREDGSWTWGYRS